MIGKYFYLLTDSIFCLLSQDFEIIERNVLLGCFSLFSLKVVNLSALYRKILAICGANHGGCIIEVNANLMIAKDINEAVLVDRILPKDHLCLFFIEQLMLSCSIHVSKLEGKDRTIPLLWLSSCQLFFYLNRYFNLFRLFFFFCCEDQL